MADKTADEACGDISAVATAVLKAEVTGSLVAPTPAAAHPPWRQTIPAELLYWGTSSLTSASSEVTASERYALERWLPVDCDQVHVVGAPTVDGRRVMVAIEPEGLRRWLVDQAAVGPDIWEVVPECLPPGMPAVRGSAPLSVLVGAFEPAARRRLRQRVQLGLFVASIVAALLMLIGSQRSVAWTQHEAQRLADEAAAHVAALLPPGAGDPSTPEERLTMAVRRLDARASAPGAGMLPVPQLLQRVLMALPPSVRLQVENLSVASDRITLRFRVLDLVAAEAVHGALKAIAPELHVRAEALQAQAQDGAAVATVTLIAESP